MSFLPISEENKEAPTGATTNAPQTTAPPQTSGSVGAGTEGPPRGASQGSPTQFGSSASKLSDYLSANAPQITQQAESVAGNLNQQYGNISQGITNAANQFGQQVQGGYAAPNQELVGQATQNPTEFVQNPENVQAFQKQYNDAYTGPLAFESTSPYSEIQGQVGQAVQQGNLLGTEAGLQSYLLGQGSNPTRASTTLDTLLLRGNPEAQAKIRGAANQLGSLGEQLQTATTGANALIPQAQQQAQAAQTQAQAAIQSVVGDLTNQVQTALDAAQAKFGQNSTYTAIQAAVNNGQPLTSEQAQIIGIDPAVYARKLDLARQISATYNNFKPSLADYFTPGQLMSVPPTAANVATPEMYARAAALRMLTGGSGPNLPINPDLASMAGGFNPNVASPSLDIAKAGEDIRNTYTQDDINAILRYTGGVGFGLPPIQGVPYPGKALERAYLAGTTNQFNPSQRDIYGNEKSIGGRLPGDPPPRPNPAYVPFGSNPGVYI